MVDEQRIRTAIRSALQDRGRGRTICPSEVARALADDWRPLMPLVRTVAAGMAARGEIAVTQRGRKVDIDKARGPVRLGLR